MPKWQGRLQGSSHKDQNPYNDQRVMASDPKKCLNEICNKFGWPCEYIKREGIDDGSAERNFVWCIEVGIKRPACCPFALAMCPRPPHLGGLTSAPPSPPGSAELISFSLRKVRTGLGDNGLMNFESREKFPDTIKVAIITLACLKTHSLEKHPPETVMHTRIREALLRI